MASINNILGFHVKISPLVYCQTRASIYQDAEAPRTTRLSLYDTMYDFTHTWDNIGDKMPLLSSSSLSESVDAKFKTVQFFGPFHKIQKFTNQIWSGKLGM